MPQTKEWIERYLARELAPFRSQADRSAMSEFAAFIDQQISAGITRLNSLPESDPFWTNTNREPTLFKLADFCRESLQRDPGDVEARWTLFAYDVKSGSSDLGYPYIEPLLASDLSLILRLSASARWGYLSFGGDALRCFKAVLEELRKKIPALESRLRELQKDSGDSVRQAASWALEALAGRNPFRSDS